MNDVGAQAFSWWFTGLILSLGVFVFSFSFHFFLGLILGERVSWVLKDSFSVSIFSSVFIFFLGCLVVYFSG